MKRTLSILLGSASALAFTAAPLAAQDIFDLGEIVVTATASPTERERTGASVEVLDSDDIEASQTTRLSDTLDLLPGVLTTQSGPTGTAADLRIRGSRERYTAVFIDGIKVNDPSVTSGQFANFGTITNSGITRVEVLKGSQSALYGGAAVAGVINIFTLPGDDTPEGVTQRTEVMAGSYGTYSANYAVVQKQDRLTLNFGLGRIQSDGFSAAERDNGNSEDDNVRENRLNFGAAYELTDAITIGINGFATDGSSEFDEFASEPVDGTPDEKGDRDSKALRLYAEIDGDVWDQNIALSYFRVDRRLSSPTVGAETAANFGAPFDSDYNGQRTRLDYSADTQLSQQVGLTLGFDVQREKAEYANLSKGSEKVDIWGAFAEGVYSPTADLDLIGTLRHDHHSSFGGKTTGRFAFSWRSSERLTLRGAAATGYRPPSIDELYGDYPGAFPFAGNPDLTPEKSRSYELGADYNFVSGAKVSATAFLTEIDDLITYEFGIPISTLVNIPGKSKRKGIELSGDLPLGERYDLFGSYTYVDASDAGGDQLVRVPKHDLLVGLRVAVTDALDAQLFVNHIADRADEFGQVMDNYTVVNASASYALTDQAEVFVRLDNLLNEDYQTTAGYGTPERSVYVGVRATF